MNTLFYLMKPEMINFHLTDSNIIYVIFIHFGNSQFHNYCNTLFKGSFSDIYVVLIFYVIFISFIHFENSFESPLLKGSFKDFYVHKLILVGLSMIKYMRYGECSIFDIQ